MTLVNLWTRDFTKRIARVVVTTTHREIWLPPMGDLAGAVIRAPETVQALHITATNLTPEFKETVVHALCNGFFTCEDEEPFAFIAAEVTWHTNLIEADAMPLVHHLRRTSLPDWYVPDEKFC